MIELKHDPIEETDAYKAVVDEVNRKVSIIIDKNVEENIKKCGDVLGEDFIRSLPLSHMVVSEKKRILKEEYGIDWKSEIEMNTDIIID